MSEIFNIKLPDGRVVGIQANSPEEAAQGAKNIMMREGAAAKGKADAGNYSDSLGQAFGGGVLQGAGDEVTAAVRAAFPSFSDWMMQRPRQTAFGSGDAAVPDAAPPSQTVSSAPTYEGRYEEELARERAKAEKFAADNPKAAAAAHIAGAVAPMIPLSMMGVPLALPMSQVGGVLGTGLRLGSAALTGAGYGGVGGFLGGEGGFDERLDSARKGAEWGGVLGPAFMLGAQGAGGLGRWAATTPPGQAVLSGVQKVADVAERLGSVRPKSLSADVPEGAMVPGDNPATYLADRIRNATMAPGDAVKRQAAATIATAVERGRITPAEALEQLKGLGDDAMLADVTRSLMRTGRMTRTLEGETADVADTLLNQRAGTYNPKLRSAIEGPNPPPEGTFFTEPLPELGGNIFDKTAREVGNRAYQGEMVPAGLTQSPELRQLLANPKIADASLRVMNSLKEARIGTGRPPESPVEVMHMIKREIQGLGLNEHGQPGSTAFQWTQTANDFVDALKAANPELRAADVAYAKAKSLPDFYETGTGIFDRSTRAGDKLPSTVEQMLKTADVMQGNALQFGAINAGRAATGGTDANAIALARQITQSSDIRRKVTSAFGERADDIFKAADTIMRFERTRSGVLGGSQTTDKAAEIAGGVNFSGLKVPTGGGDIMAALQKAQEIWGKVSAPNEAVRDEIGRMVFSPNQGQNAQTLALVEEMLKQRAASRAGAARVGGVVGGNTGGGAP
jgi:hypothetical protein